MRKFVEQTTNKTMTHYFSDVPNAPKPTKIRLTGRIIFLAVLGLVFWAAMWIFG